MLFLAQTDTTAGFLSKSQAEINKAKNRALNTPCILTMAYFSELLHFVRVPKVHKNLVRKARKTSFVYANSRNSSDKALNLNAKNSQDFKGGLACRVVKDSPHSEFLAKNGAFFSSSANAHGEDFSPQKALEIAAKHKAIIIDKKLFLAPASALIRLSKTRKKKLR